MQNIITLLWFFLKKKKHISLFIEKFKARAIILKISIIQNKHSYGR